jgi:PAP2 superfamily protein
MKIPMPAKILLTIALCGGAVLLVTNAYFAGSAMPFVFFMLTLASVILVLLRVGRSWLDIAFMIASAVILGIISAWRFHYQPNWESCVSFLGLGSLLVLGLRAVWSEGEKQKLLALAFAPSFLFSAFMVFAGVVLDRMQVWHPKTLDLYLFSFDASLHVQFPFLLGQAFAMWPWFKIISVSLYIALPIPIAMVYAGQLLRDKVKAFPGMTAFLITGPIGILFYNFFPALGPVHIFQQGFPWHPLTTTEASHLFLEPISVKGIENAIPSLHMSWVLLAWWYSRGLSAAERAIAMTFVVFTAFATLGTGEHYFVDLVVAYPFSVMIQSFCAFSLRWNQRDRITAALYGLLTTLAWFLALRYAPKLFWASPIVPWTCGVATVASALFLHWRLEAAADAVVRQRSQSPAEMAVALS